MTEAIQGAQSNHVGSIGGAGMASQGSYLSPEMVLFTLKTRLNNIDGQIERINDMINYKTEQAKAINERIGNLQGILKTHTENEKIDTTKLSAEARQLLADEGLSVNSEEQRKDVEDLIKDIGEYTHDLHREVVLSDEEREELLQGIHKGLEDLGIDTEDLEAARATLERMSRNKLEPNQIEQAINKLNTDLSKLNAGNETQMLTLQQIVSQRGQEVTLATNMLRKLDEAASKVAQNI